MPAGPQVERSSGIIVYLVVTEYDPLWGTAATTLLYFSTQERGETVLIWIFLKQICLCKEAAKLACYLASTQAGANTAAGCPKPADDVSHLVYFILWQARKDEFADKLSVNIGLLVSLLRSEKRRDMHLSFPTRDPSHRVTWILSRCEVECKLAGLGT